MKTFTITDASGRTQSYEGETQASALRQHTERFPGVAVLGITETADYQARADTIAAYGD